MKTKQRYTAFLVSKDSIFTKAVSILMDLFYKTSIHSIASLGELNLSNLSNLNPDFVIFDIEGGEIGKPDLKSIQRLYPGALLCGLVKDKNNDISFNGLFHHLIIRELLIQDFKQTTNMYLDHKTKIQKKPKEEYNTPIKAEPEYSNLYRRLFKQSDQKVMVQLD